MTARGFAAIGLLVIGAVLRVPVAAVLGVVALAVEVAHLVWASRGMTGVRYSRHIATDRLAWGDEAEVAIEVWNRKALPLAWLQADDATTPGLLVRERATIETEELGPLLRNTWTLAPYERVVRHLRITADRRGVFSLGPAWLSVGDLFARTAATAEVSGTDSFVMWPRTVPAGSVVRPDRWGDLDRARRGLAEDPSRFAGVRPYSPGDPVRRIHARTSERVGHPMTKRFEPSRERDVLVALDLQTEPGPGWDLSYDEEVLESLLVITGSVARSLAREHAAFGLTVAAYSGLPRRFADVGVSSAGGQAERVLDLLARLSSNPSARYETLLARIERRTSNGTTVLALTARDPRTFVRPLRRLLRAGFGVAVLTAGPDAEANAAFARSTGFAARAAVLDGPWRTATQVSIQ